MVANMNIVEKQNYYLFLKIVNSNLFSYEEIGNLADTIFFKKEIAQLVKDGDL